MVAEAEKLAAQAERLKRLRTERRVTDDGKRLTQEVVADIVGVTQRAYQEWEAGRGDMKPENLMALARFYGTTPDFIEYGTVKRGTPDAMAALNDGEPESVLLERIRALEDLVSGLDEQVRLLRGELAAGAAEVLKRLDEGLPPIRASRR